MMDIKEILRSKQQDAVLWKSRKVWEAATNPDKEVEATNQIVSMLFCIKNAIKRDRYITRITTSINSFVTDKADHVKSLKKEIDTLRKDYSKNQTNSIKQAIDELQYQYEEANEYLLPKIKEASLKQYIKDLQKSKLAQDKEQLQKAREVKAQLGPEDIGLPDDFEGDLSTAINYGIYEQDNKYFIRGAKDTWHNVSTFTMKVHYLVRESAECAYRVITMTNHYNQERSLTINTDDLTSSGAFKKVVSRLSNFSWLGKDEDLTRLNEYLQRDEKHAMQLNVLGFNSRHKFWAWGNGILDLTDKAEFIPADDFGMVETKSGNTFFIPSANQLNGLTDDVNEISPESKFVYTDTKLTFNEWSRMHRIAYQENSAIGQLWYVASIFRDVIFGHPSIKRFPSLFLYGPPGVGKGSFTNSVLSLNGFPQSSISLESNTSTPKGILRSFAQFKNGIVWLDEYKNSIPKNLIALLKQIYDGSSYARAKKSNDARTESTPIHASAIVSGQDMPTIEAALLERFILLQFEEKKDRTHEEIENFNKLAEFEDEGLSTIATQLLTHRNHFAQNFMHYFKIAFSEMKTELQQRGIKDRYQMNFAILLASFDTLQGRVAFDFDRTEVFELLVNKAQEQSNLSSDNNDIAKFWGVVEFLISQNMIVQNKNYKIENNLLYIKLQDVHPLYIKELKARGDNFALDKATLENYIRADKELFVEQRRTRFGNANAVYTYALNYEIIEKRYKICMDLGVFSKNADEAHTAPVEENPFRSPAIKNLEQQQYKQSEISDDGVPF